jgi:hypothetical protein
MKILVCGGRDYENFIKVDQVLERYHAYPVNAYKR